MKLWPPSAVPRRRLVGVACSLLLHLSLLALGLWVGPWRPPVVVKKLSHLPVVVDPSHGTGHWEYVGAMARAGLAAGADGLIIEVHNKPEEALSDGPQSLKPERFAELMADLRRLAPAVGRKM